MTATAATIGRSFSETLGGLGLFPSEVPCPSSSVSFEELTDPRSEPTRLIRRLTSTQIKTEAWESWRLFLWLQQSQVG